MATIRKRGNKWQVQIRRQDAKPITKSFLTNSAAKRWAIQTEALVEAGEYTHQQQTSYSFKDLLVRYRDEISPKKKGALEEQYRLNVIIRDQMSFLRANELTSKQFAAYRDKRLKSVSPSSVKRELVIIRHCLNLAINEWGIPLAENPIHRLTIPRESQARQRRLSSDEERILLSNCNHSVLRDAIRLAIETGMRRGELLNAKWEHLDTQRGLLDIPETKNGSSRTIPLTSRALEVLSSKQRGGSHIIPITSNALRLAWERLYRATGIHDLRFHDLRHEAISRFFEMGLSIAEVQLISGHKDVRTLMRYTHLRPEDVRQKLI